MLVTVWLSVSCSGLSPWPAVVTVPFFYLAAFVAWLLFFALVTWGMIRQRFPSRDTVRICTSSITPAGFQDRTPDGVRFRTWKSIISIREDNGDLHFWTWGGGHFIPREAWNSLNES